MTVDKRLIDLFLGDPINDENPFANVVRPVEPPRPAMGSIFGSNLVGGVMSPSTGTENFNALMRALSSPSPTLPAVRPAAPVTPAVRPQPARRTTYFPSAFTPFIRLNNTPHTYNI